MHMEGSEGARPNLCQKRPTIGAKEIYYMRTFESLHLWKEQYKRAAHSVYKVSEASMRREEKTSAFFLGRIVFSSLAMVAMARLRGVQEDN
jgi:hypothetical protein